MYLEESILILSGAGGVGQAAINVCQYYNCDIYVTVGNEEKKQFLINKYNIPENKIFSSRDIQFKYKIMELTERKGVDIVLNSLTGEKLDASYECVAKRGTFVELGRYDMQLNKQLGMFDFLRGISFIGVSLDICLFETQLFAQEFFDWMHKNSTNGCIKPINRTIFRANEAENAFRYMTTGKHIGRVIIKIREEESNENSLKIINPAIEMLTNTKTFFNPEKVYIITGGLGGMGLELVHWMIYFGARNFVLTSRYGVRSNYQKFILKRLESFGNIFRRFGTKIIVSTHDSDTTKGAQKLLAEAENIGQIGGLFHLALILNDRLIDNQNYYIYSQTISCKYKIFSNLDKITRDLGYSLDYFVVFSSISCGKGVAGQTNYGFGNSLCERICEQRRRDGLHGLAIQFGAVGDVGAISDQEQVINLIGMKKQRINSCFDSLDKLLQCSQPIITCYVIAEKRSQQSGKLTMVDEIWRILSIDPETTPEHMTLAEIGLESMLGIEIQKHLDREYNLKFSLNSIKNLTIKMLKEYKNGGTKRVKANN